MKLIGVLIAVNIHVKLKVLTWVYFRLQITLHENEHAEIKCARLRKHYVSKEVRLETSVLYHVLSDFADSVDSYDSIYCEYYYTGGDQQGNYECP